MDRQKKLVFNQQNILEFRESHGRIASFGDADLLLLTSIGARSGAPRTSPMMYLADLENPSQVFVFASDAGSDQNPAWFHNLVAHPGDVEIEIGDDKFRATAKVLPEPRSAEIYAMQAARNPGFAGYQRKTSRQIPVVSITLKGLAQ